VGAREPRLGAIHACCDAHHQLAFVSTAKLGLFASIFRPHTHRLSVEAILHSEKREERESARSVSEFRALLLSTMTANQCATHFLFAGGNSAARTGTHKRVDCAPELKSE
jgi:hypothetical protein